MALANAFRVCDNQPIAGRDFRTMRASKRQISILNISDCRFWKVAILATAWAFTGSEADAAIYYWQGYDPNSYQPVPQVQPRRQKARNKSSAKPAAAPVNTAAKPQGPLIIAISIQNQKMRVFDSNGLFAQSPVSTGMKGHPTPMGVFSVIQKHKFHHSNIYSNAPMPYMQRITWSGVAIHAGVLPGYPASHGCIRMPMAFAIKMWNWTKMGARVIVTPGEVTPAAFSHPLLATQKVVKQSPAEEPKVDAPLGAKSDKGAHAEPTNETGLALRAALGEAEPRAPVHEQTHTADASGTMPAASTSITISEPTAATASGDTATAKPEQAATGAAGNVGLVSSEATPTDSAKGAVKSAEADQNRTAVTASTAAAKTELSANDSRRTQAAQNTFQAPKADASKPVEPKIAEKPAEPVKAADPTSPDLKKDPSRLPGLAKRAGQIAVLISRKDSKLYVRQNFSPLFEAPVVIAPSDRPLGTHVFTADVDKDDANQLHWSVVSLPARARPAARLDEDDHLPQRRRIAGVPAEAKPLPLANSPAEALDRITIPPDAMARITESLSTGGSIIVSDQGVNQGETGEGTDFIVSLR
jgi:lipoprotein-anchoring transpeptidase ErfK/SrfK